MADQMSLMASSQHGTFGLTEAPYHGASHRRESMRAWHPSRGSADRDVVFSLPTLNARSHDLVRNVPVAAAAVLTMTTNVVGCGIHPRPRVQADLLGITQAEADDFEHKARVLWELVANSKNIDAERRSTFYQLQDLALRTRLVAGNCFALMPFRPAPAWPFGLAVKLLDGNRVRNPTGQLDTDCFAGGIEVDEYGAPVAYHITTKPPNGMLGDSTILDTIRVPAYGETTGRPLVLHLFEQDRPDQRLGVPWLAPVIEAIKQQGRYQDAELMAAVVSGMFTVFVKTASGSPDWGGNATAGDVERAGISQQRGEIGMKYGGVVDLAEDEELQFADPTRPNPNYEPFVNAIFREITAGLGIPVEQVLKRFDSSYTAARAASLEGWKTYRRARADLCADFNQPVYETALAEFISLGLLNAPGFFEDPLRRALWSTAIWVGEAPGQLNPIVETQALKLQVDEQFKDRSTAALELSGEDYHRVVRGLAQEAVLRQANGVQDPGSVTKSASVTVQGTDGTTPTAPPSPPSDGGVPEPKED